MTTNGNHTGGPALVGLHRIEVYRVTTCEPVFVRMLSPDYKGCFTHYGKGRSTYCPGDGCKHPMHGQDRTWKGYCAAERLVVTLRNGNRIGCYVPCCLEITEYLELDLRTVYARGQLWELWKIDEGRGKKGAVTAKLHADDPPDDLRKPFDIIPCLRALYHRDTIDLKFASPLPARVYVEETIDELPQVLREEEAERPEFNISAAMNRINRAAAEGRKSPADKAKERGY